MCLKVVKLFESICIKQKQKQLEIWVGNMGIIKEMGFMSVWMFEIIK